jgi:large subunit ribosomal protein L34e
VKTPGGKLTLRHIRKQASRVKSVTGALILGIPAVRPVQFKKLKKHQRRVNRAYGGCKTGLEVRDRITRAFLIEEQKCVKQVLAEKAAAKAEEAAPAAKKDKKKSKK